MALALPATTNAEIEEKTTAINNAISGLVFAGQSALDEAVSTANELTSGDYTSVSRSVLEQALALPVTTNAEVETKTAAINAAIEALISASSYDDLTSAQSIAQ